MQVAGIRQVGDRVEIIEVGELRPLADDEVLLEVLAAGVGNWDEFVRTGGWDVGARPPMALGVEAAGMASWRFRSPPATVSPMLPRHSPW
jgi:Zn-dependent alcohol dehydrogenase